VKKITPSKSVLRPISSKIIADLRKTAGRKVVDISELRDAKINAVNLDKTIITEKELSQLDPLHGVYVYAQNKLSVIIEELSAFMKEFPESLSICEKSSHRKKYRPSYPADIWVSREKSGWQG